MINVSMEKKGWSRSGFGLFSTLQKVADAIDL